MYPKSSMLRWTLLHPSIWSFIIHMYDENDVQILPMIPLACLRARIVSMKLSNDCINFDGRAIITGRLPMISSCDY